MKRFKFYLIKNVVGAAIKYKLLNKTLVIPAMDSVEARQVVTNKFPDWQVSMFWLEWP